MQNIPHIPSLVIHTRIRTRTCAHDLDLGPLLDLPTTPRSGARVVLRRWLRTAGGVLELSVVWRGVAECDIVYT
jgi:hypothetical protein